MRVRHLLCAVLMRCSLADSRAGSNTPSYCILSCDAFNSPLFCDRDHPQVRRIYVVLWSRLVPPFVVALP